MPNEILVDEEGIRYEVVEPGSAEDPFTTQRSQPSMQVAPSPVATNFGSPVAPMADGPQVQTPQPSTPTPAPVSQPAVSPTPVPATPAPATPKAEPAPEPTPAAPPPVDIDRLVKDEVGKALRSQQSSYDKRIAALEAEKEAAREAARKAERDAKLNNEELTEEERAVLRDRYALDDEREELNKYADDLDGYYRQLYVGGLLQDYGQFGVTAEELEAISEPEEMDVYVRDKELEFYRSGGVPSVTQQVPSRAVESPVAPQPQEQVPAGAVAPSDVSGPGAPPAPAPQWDQGVGPQSLARNLNNLPWETVSIN